ncbi:hypothetical protein HKX48_008714 [Thoreauomyces humboldtii]|nr:hypothetical protein HKX48_008714 [Thoreauomyces humboldtii]
MSKQFEFRHSVSSLKARSLSWEDLKYEIPGDKDKAARTILDGVRGEVRSGEVLAILGGSGVGKTTLLQMLAGRAKPGSWSGTVLLDGRVPEVDLWSQQTCFVDQEDQLHEHITVRETLLFAARLRISGSETARQARVEHIITALQLGDCADNTVGTVGNRGISGGEKKRLAIGVHLLARPSLLFLDEPTSSLDSSSALHLVSLLSKIASADGMAIVLSIHQPRANILPLFTNICLLARGGTAYFGHVNGAISHFARIGFPVPELTNPADHFLDVLTSDQTGHNGTDFVSAWKSQNSQIQILEKADANFKDASPAIAKGHRLSWASETAMCLHREWLDVIRNRPAMMAYIVSSVVLSLIMGFIFFRIGKSDAGIISRTGLLFLIITNQFFNYVMISVNVLPPAKAFLLKDRRSGVGRVSSTIIAKFLANLPILLVLNLAIYAFQYFMHGLKATAGAFFTFYVIVIFVELCGISFGYLVGAATPSLAAALQVAPLICMLGINFSGFVAASSEIPPELRWIGWLTPLRYGISGLFQNELSDYTFTDGRDGRDIIDSYGMAFLSKWVDVGVLAGLFAAGMVLAYVALRATTKPVVWFGKGGDVRTSRISKQEEKETPSLAV